MKDTHTMWRPSLCLCIVGVLLVCTLRHGWAEEKPTSRPTRASKERPQTRQGAPKQRAPLLFEASTRERKKPTLSAGSDEVEQKRLSTYSQDQTSDLLRAVPGLHISQHTGRGKAHQFFARGFDAVHGSELELRVQGIPINERSNIHGQGYADIGFLLPTAVQRLRYRMGPFSGHQGDFAITGTLEFDLGLTQRGLSITGSLGSFWQKQLALAWGPRGQDTETFVVAQFGESDGFGSGRSWREARTLAQYQFRWRKLTIRLLAGAHVSDFESAGVLREIDFERGNIDFYDVQREGLGGRSSRVLGQLHVTWKTYKQSMTWMLYVMGRSLRLKENFTGYLLYPQGDTFEQRHDFVQTGGQMVYKRNGYLFGRRQQLEAGVEYRLDGIEQAQHRLTDAGQRHTTEIDSSIQSMSLASWLTARMRLSRWFRWQLSTRLTLLDLDIEDRVFEAPRTPTRHATGLHVAPRTMLRFRLSRMWKIFASYGLGFRSVQARSLKDGETIPLQEAHHAELGARLVLKNRLYASLSLFGVYTAQELVFDHASATNIYTGAGLRLGGELNLRLKLFVKGLWLDASVTYSDGRLVKDNSPVPYSTRLLVRGGLVYRWQSRDRFWAVMSSIRGNVIGPRPLPFGLESDTIVQLQFVTKVDIGPVFVRIDINNLLNQQWKDGQFVYSSTFDPSQGKQLLPQLHYTAGQPLRLLVSLGVRVF